MNSSVVKNLRYDDIWKFLEIARAFRRVQIERFSKYRE